MLGRFSEESLRAFAEFHNLNTGNQDFSEGIFDFKVCQKPDGKNYGIPNQDKCKAPAKEVKVRPDTGFLNTQAGKGINYDTAQKQGQSKTRQKQESDDKRKAQIAEAKSMREAEAEAKREALVKKKKQAAAKPIADKEVREAIADYRKMQEKYGNTPKQIKVDIDYFLSDSEGLMSATKVELAPETIESYRREMYSAFGI